MPREGCSCFGRRLRQVTLVLLGVDNAGKSTLLASLQHDVGAFVTPTVGFSAETVREGNHAVRIFDLGGCENFRGIWPRYYAEVHGALFVVDGSDVARLETVAKTAIHDAIDDPRLRGKPAIVYVNKQDVPGALDPQSASIRLGLPPAMPIFGCVARCSQAVDFDVRLRQGLRCLLEIIDQQWSQLNARIAGLVAEQKRLDEEERLERARHLEALRAQAREKEELEKVKAQRDKDAREKQQAAENREKGKQPVPEVLPGMAGDGTTMDPTSSSALQETQRSGESSRRTPRRWQPEAPIIEEEGGDEGGDEDTVQQEQPTMIAMRKTAVAATAPTTPTDREMSLISARSLKRSASPFPRLATAPELPGSTTEEGAEPTDVPVRVATPPRRLAPLSVSRRNSLPMIPVE